MTRQSRCSVTAAAIAVVFVSGPIRASERQDSSDALDHFQVAMMQYMADREVALRHLPAFEISRDAGKIRRAVEARASAILQFRRSSVRGEIFNPQISDLFRGRIRSSLDRIGYATVDVLGDEEVGTGEWVPALVNGRFVWDFAVTTPPCVLEVLPALPPELQYRFVGLDLALVDIDANLIVDVLSDVLESPGD